MWVIRLKLFGVEKSKSNLRWDNLIERFLSRPKIEFGWCWSPKPITDFELALRHFITHQMTYRFNSDFGLFFIAFDIFINSCAFISILPRTFICQKIGMISISANQKFLLHHWIRRKILGGVPWNIFLIGRHLLYIRFRPLCQFFGRMKAQLLKLENFPEGNFMAFLIKGRLFDPLKCLKEVIFDPPPSHGLPNRNL